MPSAKIRAKLAKVRLIVSDVDGVLTDGKIIMDDEGRQTRNFHVQDGLGICLAQELGVDVMFISGKLSPATAKRLACLGVADVHQDVQEKGPVLDEVIAKRGLRPGEICAVGDDIPDLPLFRRAGVSVAVCNAGEAIKAKAHWVTRHAGGDGALREVVDAILKAKGLWPRALARFGD